MCENYVLLIFSRNLGIILAIFVILCELHLIATEYIPAQRSRGEILLYRRKSRRSTKIQKDEEGGNLVPNPSPVSPQQLTTFEMVDIKGKDDDRGRDIRMNIQREDAIFHWSNVNYSIPIKKDARQILQNIEGWVRPGSLTALMVRFSTFRSHFRHLNSNRASPAQVKQASSIYSHTAQW